MGNGNWFKKRGGGCFGRVIGSLVEKNRSYKSGFYPSTDYSSFGWTSWERWGGALLNNICRLPGCSDGCDHIFTTGLGLDFHNSNSVAFSDSFNRVARMGSHIFRILGVRKLWEARDSHGERVVSLFRDAVLIFNTCLPLYSRLAQKWQIWGL